MLIPAEWLIAESSLPLVHALHDRALEVPEGAVVREPSAPPTLRKSGGVAHVDVLGVLMPERSALLDFFGVVHTSYAEIVAQVQDADADPEVARIDLYVDSPGGTVAGFYAAARAIACATKPTRAVATYAASAAYGLASQAGDLVAAAPETLVGSVGVAVTVRHPNTDATTTITSTAAPDKIPDPTTEHGVGVIRDHLDALHGMFADTIATGRGVSAQQVNEKFGGGRVFLAAEALARGMIDSIAPVGGDERGTQTAGACAPAQQRTNMDLETLQAAHPEAYRAAVDHGRQIERKRCTDHIKLGKEASALDVAHEAIASGESLADRQADYLAAAINRADVERSRAADLAGVAPAANGAAHGTAPNEDAREKAAADEFAAGFEAASGGKVVL